VPPPQAAVVAKNTREMKGSSLNACALLLLALFCTLASPASAADHRVLDRAKASLKEHTAKAMEAYDTAVESAKEMHAKRAAKYSKVGLCTLNQVDT
jgi:hypothetical protein